MTYKAEDLSELLQKNSIDMRKVNYVITNGVKRKVTSEVWNQFYQLFEVENNNDIKGWFLCLLCHQPVENKFAGSTTLFFRHRKHCLNVKQQKPINEFFHAKVTKTVENTKISAKYLTAMKEGAARFICDDLRPYASVEGSGLFQLISAAVDIGKSYPMITVEDMKRALPGRRTVQRTIEEKLPSVKAMISMVLLDALATCDGFACTVDLWTDKFRQKSYLAMTAHVNQVDKSIVHKRLVIGFREIEAESQTSEIVLQHMYEILVDYGLTTKQIEEKVDFVSDRGSQFMAMHCIRRSNCFAHMINNIVKAICADASVRSIIDDAKSLVKYAKKSKLNHRNDIVVESHCDTRWNTVYTMLRSILNSYQGIY